MLAWGGRSTLTALPMNSTCAAVSRDTWGGIAGSLTYTQTAQILAGETVVVIYPFQGKFDYFNIYVIFRRLPIYLTQNEQFPTTSQDTRVTKVAYLKAAVPLKGNACVLSPQACRRESLALCSVCLLDHELPTLIDQQSMSHPATAS